MSARQFFSKVGSAIGSAIETAYVARLDEVSRALQYYGARRLNVKDPVDLDLLVAIQRYAEQAAKEAVVNSQKMEW